MAYFVFMIVKKIYKIFLATICILVLIQSVSAQDSLVIYTQASCSNCKAVKRTLINNNINFIEKDLADQHNALEMLHKLKTLQFTKDINLPVIFLNKRMYHPAYQTPPGLITLDIANVVDTLIRKYKSGELHFTNLQLAPQPTTTPQTINSESDCSIQATNPSVLIVAEFSTETDAKTAMQKLIDNGYSYAGIVFSNGMYRVYNKLFLKQELAEQELINTRKYNQNCYLLAIAK